MPRKEACLRRLRGTGGKTAHSLELADVDMTALEIDPKRASRITENLDRLGLKAKVTVADAGDPKKWWDGRPFERILLDAPCTASGIVRRHPGHPLVEKARRYCQTCADSGEASGNHVAPLGK